MSTAKTDHINEPPRGAPLTALDAKAVKGWFEIFVKPTVESNRFFTFAVVLGLIVLGQAVAISYMLPLKTVVPYVVKVHDDGNVKVEPAGVTAYSPQENETRYFLKQWVSKVKTLNYHLTEQYLSEAYLQTRGQATKEFKDFLRDEAPIERLQMDRTLTRTVQVISVNFIREKIALVRLSTEERTAKNPKPERTTYSATIQFELVPPKTEAEIMENPIGLFITHFAFTRELS